MTPGEGHIGKIAVVGAAGFLGRRVVRRLADRGLAVRAVMRHPGQASAIDAPGVEPVFADVRDLAALEAAFDGAASLVHLAAILRERRGATLASVNESGAANVYEAAARSGVGRAVHVSIVGAAEDSPAPYMASRWRGEQIALKSEIGPSILRLSALFGEGDEFTNALAAFVRLGPLMPVAGDGKTRFQPLSADDAAEAIARALEGAVESRQTVELGGPETMTYDEIANAVAEAMGRRLVKVHVPISLLSPVVKLMNLVLSTPPVTTSQLQMLRLDNTPLGRPFEDVFGFAPGPMSGNIDYVRRVGYREALQIVAGRMPAHIRDH
jgi:NADH dehydrogenase